MEVEEERSDKKEEEIVVKIETIGEKSDKMSPIVGYFPSGFDPLKNRRVQGLVEEEEGSSTATNVKVYRHVKRSNRLKMVVRPTDGSRVDFVGTSYTGEAAAPQVCTYALGVLDKATKTLKIVPIAANKIFRLEPKVRGSEIADDEPSEMVAEELTAQVKVEKKKELALAYSDRKSIRRDAKFEAIYQKEDPRYKEELDRTLENVQINKEALEGANSTIKARNIPPHDLSATEPQKAYPLDKIITKWEWNQLLDILELSEAGEELPPEDYPNFVCNRVYRLEHMQDDKEKRRLSGIFSYITHLVKFNDKHSMDGYSSAKYHKIPKNLYQKFSSMFSDVDSKRLSSEKKDLLISYVLVLTLFVDDFKTDPTDIAKDFRMTSVAIRQHYSQLGCKFVRDGKSVPDYKHLATLPIPLEFPEIRRKRRR